MENDLRTALEKLLNSFSAENGSNTPDFILANYLHACLEAFDEATKERDLWKGREREWLGPVKKIEADENTIIRIVGGGEHPISS